MWHVSVTIPYCPNNNPTRVVPHFTAAVHILAGLNNCPHNWPHLLPHPTLHTGYHTSPVVSCLVETQDNAQELLPHPQQQYISLQGWTIVHRIGHTYYHTSHSTLITTPPHSHWLPHTLHSCSTYLGRVETAQDNASALSSSRQTGVHFLQLRIDN